MQFSVPFPSGEVQYYTDHRLGSIGSIIPRSETIIITDTNIERLYREQFSGFKAVIAIAAGEDRKTTETINHITSRLLEAEAHRKTMLLGVGGGVVTDITGFVASIYMRGVPFGFVPTSLLGMVDAAIGGKNGVNIGLHKNLLGTFKQPDFLFYDTDFLATLPAKEWSNGFAEIIKYACIFDAALFEELEKNELDYYRNNSMALNELVSRCVKWKNQVVIADEKETSTRKLLNFGHTAGHAIETVHSLPHGHAVALGMLIACILSAQLRDADKSIFTRLAAILTKYGLPSSLQADPDALMEVLKMDKKRNSDTIDYILLDKIGQASIVALSPYAIKDAIIKFCNGRDH